MKSIVLMATLLLTNSADASFGQNVPLTPETRQIMAANRAFYQTLPSLESKSNVSFSKEDECLILEAEKSKIRGLVQELENMMDSAKSLPPFTVSSSCLITEYEPVKNKIIIGLVYGAESKIEHSAGALVHEYTHMLLFKELLKEFPDLIKFEDVQTRFHGFQSLVLGQPNYFISPALIKEFNEAPNSAVLFQTTQAEYSRLEKLISIYLTYSEYLSEGIAAITLGQPAPVIPERDFSKPFDLKKWRETVIKRVQSIGEPPFHNSLEPSWFATWHAFEPYMNTKATKKLAANTFYNVVKEQVLKNMRAPESFDKMGFAVINGENEKALLEAFGKITPP